MVLIRKHLKVSDKQTQAKKDSLYLFKGYSYTFTSEEYTLNNQ